MDISGYERWLIELIKKYLTKTMYGKIEINIQAGKITNVNVTQSFKK